MEAGSKMDVHLDASNVGGVSRREVLEGPSGGRRRSRGERARIAAESLMPGSSVAEVARRHGVTRWQVYDWRRRLRSGQLVVPEAVAALPVFAELVVEEPPADAPPPMDAAPGLEIIVGEIVIRAGAGTDETLLTRAIRAARAAGSRCLARAGR